VCAVCERVLSVSVSECVLSVSVSVICFVLAKV